MLLRDPVHGLISFSSRIAPTAETASGVDPIPRLIHRLMDTAPMQRLRRIRALGLASLVFPGGEHSRFAHALGSAYVMRRYLDRVAQLSGELPAHDRVDGQTAAVAMAAALLHDLGHGPLSHTFEVLFPQAVSHETWTSRLVLDPDSEVHQILVEIDTTAPQAVERLIHGHSEIRHLARAVSGTFDVDRCDYLMRDSHMTGVRYGLVDLEWLLASLRLHQPDGETRARVAVDGSKGLTAVEGFFLARLYMYRQVYLHKAVRSAEMVIKALFRRLHEIGPPPGTPAPLAACIRGEGITTGAFLELDDYSLHVALCAFVDHQDPILAELAVALRDRKLFKSCGLRPDVDSVAASARLDEVLEAAGLSPRYYGDVDRVELQAYVEDEAMVVLGHSGEMQPLLRASPVLHGLSGETFVQHRAFYPRSVAEKARRALVEFH